MKKTLHKNDVEIDAALFDKTLTEIERTLKILGEKIETKRDHQINENAPTIASNVYEEHVIDNTHLRMEELHNFSSKPVIEKKKSFGFYTYLALTVAIVFAIYEILNISKNLIILKYPASEPYIEYFYEIIEILAYLFMNMVSFAKNLIQFGAP